MRTPFTPQTIRRQSMREAPSKYLTSRLRANIERSEGQRPAEAFYPSKFLPILWQDVETEDGVVITKGTIVSLLTSVVNASGMVDIASSGVIPVFDDATTSAVDTVTANIDSSYWGYPDSVAGLLVPANGGVQSDIPYSALDVTIGNYRPGGQPITNAILADAAQNFYRVAGNMPVGVVYQDIYQDIRGKNLNYQLFNIWGILCDYYIEIPFVDYGAVTYFVSGVVNLEEDRIANMNATTCAGYIATWKKYPFLYGDFTNSAIGGYPGQLLMPDLYGKFTPQGTAVTTAATAQTVGKLILTDSRFPKGAMEHVSTFTDSRMPGTETGGIPSMLYEFVRDAYYGINGSYPTASTVVSEIQSGKYGVARIQLNI